MLRWIEQKSKTSKILMMTMVIAIFALSVRIAQAQGAEYGFGWKDVSGVRGLYVEIWTDEPPNGLTWTAAPIGICQALGCAHIVETGWTKGTAEGRGDKLGQYVVWTDAGGFDHRQYNIGSGALPQSTWLWFKVLYSNSASRWEAWLGSNVVWFQPYDLGWTSGATMAIGGENHDWNGYINASHYHPQYKVGNGSWTLYNYAYRNTAGQGCIRPEYDFGAFAWGPTSSCP